MAMMVMVLIMRSTVASSIVHLLNKFCYLYPRLLSQLLTCQSQKSEAPLQTGPLQSPRRLLHPAVAQDRKVQLSLSRPI